MKISISLIFVEFLLSSQSLWAMSYHTDIDYFFQEYSKVVRNLPAPYEKSYTKLFCLNEIFLAIHEEEISFSIKKYKKLNINDQTMKTWMSKHINSINEMNESLLSYDKNLTNLKASFYTKERVARREIMIAKPSRNPDKMSDFVEILSSCNNLPKQTISTNSKKKKQLPFPEDKVAQYVLNF